jgi:hypothetical protein
MPRVVALVACAAFATGCFGYSPPAKKWAYVGDTLLILGGGGAIAGDLLTHEPCEGVSCPEFDPPFGGGTVAGVVLVTAGIVGLVINATREPVKTSR